MDLLSQYKQDHPEAFQEKKAVPMADEYGRTYPAMVRLAMRLSGGRIRTAQQANYALLAAVVVIILVALLLFFGVPGSAPTQPNIINP